VATDAALEMGLITVGLTGRDGGRLGGKVQYHLNVPHNLPARVQEVHIMIGHILCDLADENVKGS
jgi:D-sedoheptulose 7-phosphate isomerase